VYTHPYTMYTLGDLSARRYISLTTFKRDGSAVSTPVWVVSDDGERLLVWTAASTWKVRRVRRNPNVLVAASNFRGRERGERLLRRKYGWQKRALDLLNRRSENDWATVELTARATR